MFNLFAVTFAVAGSLTSDTDFNFTVPCPMSLVAVSAGADNTTTANFNVGTATDPDGYLDDKDMGVDNAPTLFDLDDFNGDLVSDQGADYPHLAKDDIIQVNIDVDSSTDPDDPCIVLFFQVG